MLRRSTVAVIATVAFTVPAAAGCGAVDTALNCAKTAATVARAADDLQRAVSDASEDPAQARQSLDRIDKNLKKIEDETDDGDVGKAVGKLGDAVDSVRGDIEQGQTPKTAPVGEAADELTKVCTPG